MLSQFLLLEDHHGMNERLSKALFPDAYDRFSVHA